EDILNGRLDNSGPPRDGRRLGLRCIGPDNVEGPQLLEYFESGPRLLHHVIAMKEAVLDFAARHELPPPSWWVQPLSTPTTEVPKDTKVNAVKPKMGAAASRFVGKQPRILKYLSEHFPDGVPEPGLCPRYVLRSDILEWDPSLDP